MIVMQQLMKGSTSVIPDFLQFSLEIKSVVYKLDDCECVAFQNDREDSEDWETVEGIRFKTGPEQNK